MVVVLQSQVVVGSLVVVGSGVVVLVQATARPGVSLTDIERTVTAEISRLAKEGPTVAELDRAKTKQNPNSSRASSGSAVSRGNPTS